jgi:acyl-[acyl-carrier-protein]-phospholipid O-acyltransferase/long-chain-fatty-acid--[acyl-carrier-protein] ligase
MSAIPNWIWWVVATGAILAALYAALPVLIRPFLRLLLGVRYRFRIVGAENLPERGPFVLAANHVTWIDGFVLAAACRRRGEALVNATYLTMPVLGHLARRAGMIPIPSKGPRAQRAGIDAARNALARGEGLLIFPEAQISRTGFTGSFYRGIELIMKGYDSVPVVPVFLDNLWGSIFSFAGGRFLTKLPRGWRRTVIIAFGPAVAPPVTTYSVRQATIATGVPAYAARDRPEPLETIELQLPHWRHPEFGLLAASTADYDRDDIHQTGQKPSTVGQAVPGVALRVVDDAGRELSADTEGELQALLAGRSDWVNTQQRGSIDRDGFVRLG